MPRADPVTVIAHRGASAYALENTLAACDAALARGADALEIDARRSADGQLVALHDPTLERTAGDPRELASMPAAELTEIDPALRPPTLDAVFRRYHRATRYWVDMKDPDEVAERALIELLARHDLDGHLRVQSFEPECLPRIHRRDPGVPIAQLYRRVVPPDYVLDDLERVAELGAIAVGRAWELVDERLMDATGELGLAVHAYTLNDEASIERVLALGVRTLISDRPDLARAVVDGLVPA